MSNERETKLRPVISWLDYRIDPRFFILLFLLSFVIAGQVYLGFYQQWNAVFTAVGCSTATELLLSRVKYKRWMWPISGIITGLGVSLLLSSHKIWPYALAAVLSIGLKYIIRFKGSHIFNPNNVAMVIMLLFLPQFAVSTPKQWTNGIEIMIIILCLGIFACYMANRLDSVIAFLGSFALFAWLRHVFFGAPLYAAFGPMMGASLQLFTFFMITDPKSTPTTRKARMAFAFLIALIDAIFRVNRIPNPQFYALFLTCLVMIIPYRIWINHKIQKERSL